MTLNLAQVRAFATVLEAGGFLEAAKRLGCAQPTVTQLVRKLETELGARLIVRSRNGAQPTPAGARFLPHALRLLHAESRAIASVSDRSLVVGAGGNIGTYLLPRLLGDFRVRAGVTAELVIATNPEIADRVECGDIDLAIMEWWDGRPGCHAEPWRQEQLVVIVPPHHPWAGEATIPPAELLETPMIGGEPGTGTGRLLREAFGEAADRVTISMTLGSTAAVKEAVRAGLGISLVMRAAVHDEVTAGSLRAIDLAGAPLKKTLFVVKPDGLPPTTMAARFHALLRDAA
ncbi:MAG: transcriptional regulator [Rhodospirillaceae bacterium]|nr:transcriptional regulator [Rhodospirillaceae bacterium]